MPDPITWYTLPRTVDDLETIQEKIDAKILTHNQDPSAHGQSGESVYDHRTDTDLDHPDGSVSLKKLVETKKTVFTNFESLDGWEVSGFQNVNILGTTVRTGNVANNTADIHIEPDGLGDHLDFAKDPFFQIAFHVGALTSQLVYVVAGPYPDPNGFDRFGFKIVNGTLYAIWTKAGAENTQVITGITLNTWNVFRAYCDSAEGKIYFYINGVLKYTATANYPTGDSATPFTVYIKTTVAASRYIYMASFLWMQDI